MMLPTILAWVGFIGAVAGLLAGDLFLFHRGGRDERRREALLWSAIWIGLALLFNLGIYLVEGPDAGLQWTAGYLLEKALSVDNVFVFLLLFSAFAVPAAYQRRVLFWGVLGALVLRGGLILAGGALLARLHVVLYLFGALLVVTGIRFVCGATQAPSPERNVLVRLTRRLLPTTPGYEGERFIVRRNGTWFATPLLLVLVLVESTDVLFALDSVPAVYGVTDDPFIVFTSNVMAILGLRALFLLLRSSLTRIVYLRPALAAVLVLVGAKMLASDLYEVPALMSLLVIVAVFGGAVAASLIQRWLAWTETEAGRTSST